MYTVSFVPHAWNSTMLFSTLYRQKMCKKFHSKIKVCRINRRDNVFFNRYFSFSFIIKIHFSDNIQGCPEKCLELWSVLYYDIRWCQNRGKSNYQENAIFKIWDSLIGILKRSLKNYKGRPKYSYLGTTKITFSVIVQTTIVETQSYEILK